MHKNNLNSDSAPQQSVHDHAENGISCHKDVALIDNVAASKVVKASANQEQCSPEEKSLKLFKVFIKRSLPVQKPAPDLLVRIHKKIDAIREESNN